MMQILSVASEMFPLIKTGGLADVVGALPAAVAPHGISATTMVPGYPRVMDRMANAAVVREWPDLLGHSARLLAAQVDGHAVYALDAPDYFDREAGPYTRADGTDWPDNGRRFAAFAYAAAACADDFDLVHTHDWQAALVAVYRRYGVGSAAIPSIITIHNIAFQGRYDAELFAALRLPPAAWHSGDVEYYGGVGFLKGGLACADAITAVSPSYAREVRTAEFGMGLDGLMRVRADDTYGILNGIDPAIWNPATDTLIKTRYKTAAGKRANKRALEAYFGLERGDDPLFVVVSRLTWQKGMHLLAEWLDSQPMAGWRLAVLGNGDRVLEQAFMQAAARHPGRIAVKIGYNEPLSHLMQAGGDAILIPSQFEPCGLTQLYGLAYGCVPVAARTGGLSDTIIDANPAAQAAGVATGVLFDLHVADDIGRAIARTCALYADTAQWRQIQRNGMRADFSWTASGAHYAALYRRVADRRARA